MKRFVRGMGRALGLVARGLGAAGRATIALVGICGVVAALANYTMTQGAGTTFGSIVVSTIHYAQMLTCDPTTPSQCGAVDASGNQAVKDAAVLAAVQAAIPSQSPAVPVGGVGICDGANGATNPCTTAATVKAASTAPVAADKALVAALSPNTAEVGTPATGVTQPTGGVGLSGWLSGIYSKLSATLTAAIDPTAGAATPAFAFLGMPATTTTQLIALSGSTKTYITSLRVIAGGTVNVTFKYGTGSNCGTGTTTLEGPYPLTAQSGFAAGAGLGAVLIVPAGQALCVTTDASVSGGVAATYQQK